MNRFCLSGMLLAMSVGLLSGRCHAQGVADGHDRWLQKHWQKGAAVAAVTAGAAVLFHLNSTKFKHDMSQAQRETLSMGEGVVARIVQGFSLDVQLTPAFRCRWFEKTLCGTRVTAIISRPAGGASAVWCALTILHKAGALQRSLELGIEVMLRRNALRQKGRIFVRYKFLSNGDLRVVGCCGDDDYVDCIRQNS